MTSFAETCLRRGVHSLSVFGDSITFGLAASLPERRWADRLAAAIGATTLRNKGIAGTVMQASPLADGAAKPGNGVSRYRTDLLGQEKSGALAILYGYNDARYVAAPRTFNVAGFLRDYRTVVEGLLAGGYGREVICLGSPSHIVDAGFSVGNEGFTGQTRAGFEAFVGAVEGLAKTYGLFYAPVYETMRSGGRERLASPDITHPNDEGHRVIAETFLAATQR